MNLGGREMFGATPLMWSAARGDLPELRRLLSEGLGVDDENDHRQNALIYAASEGKYEAVALLLSAGAKIEHKDRHGCTALIYAASRGHLEVVQDLLQRGANIEAKNNNDVTALMEAAAIGRREIVACLLGKGSERGRSRYFLLYLIYKGRRVSFPVRRERFGLNIPEHSQCCQTLH